MRNYRYVASSGPAEAAGRGEIDYQEKLLSAVNNLPPLTVVLNRLLQMLNDAKCSSGQIAATIEQDSVLGASVLRCVNSAYYGLPHRISSIRQAVTLLGFSSVRNLALAFSMRRMLVNRGTASTKLYSNYSQHALGCAIMSQFLAHYTRSEDRDAAFAAGLFHDLGRLLIINTLPRMLPGIVSHWEQSNAPFEESEQALLGVTHPELSAVILEKWQLPESIREAARYHHDPDSCPADPDHPITLAHLVHAADVYVRSYGLEVISSPLRPPPPPDEAFEKIGLLERLPEFFERFQSEFGSIRGAF